MLKKRWFKLFIFLMVVAVVFLLVWKKKEHVNITEDKAAKCLELMNVDREFSDMSKEKGMKTAYIDFIDSNGVMLRPNQMPIAGANAIDYLIQQDDGAYALSWEPQHAEISESGDMGFTYGIYLLHPKSIDTSVYGTYTNIWRKQQDGKWKLLLNTSNEGVGQ